MNDIKRIILIVLVAGLVVLAQKTGKKQAHGLRSLRLMKKYARITPQVWETIPREDLVDAMVSRVLAGASASRCPDPVQTLSGISHSYTVVYSVWAVCKELATGDFAALMQTPTAALVEPAAEAMKAIGAPRCAVALEAMLAAYTADGESAPSMEDYRVAVTEETPLSLCEEYIIDHREEFLDTQEG